MEMLLKALCAAATALCICYDAAAAGYMLSLDTPKPSASHEDGKTKSKGGRYNRTRTSSETVTRTMAYNGSVSRVGSTREKSSVRVEAYFVVAGVGEGGGKESIGDKIDIGTFHFGPGKKPRQEFSFKSPGYKQTNEKKQRNRGRGGRYGSRQRQTKSTSHGQRLCGVIVRGIDEKGNVVCVKALPGKSEWEKAGRMPNVPDKPPKR